MYFKEMKTEDRAKLIEGYEDVLTPLVNADRQIYEGVTCPRCDALASKELDLRRTLSSNRIIPRYNCRCLECGCLFEPITRLVIEMGNLGKLQPDEPVHIVDPADGH